MKLVKRTALIVGLVLVLLVPVGLVIRTRTCSAWQDDYKRFLYSEMMKNSPVIFTPEDIDRIIGEKPPGCTRPMSLTEEDRARYREQSVGPNEFNDEMRETNKRSSS
jgi:hypothetical protein